MPFDPDLGYFGVSFDENGKAVSDRAPVPTASKYKPVTSAGNINAQKALVEVQKNVSSYASPIPVVYGRAQIGGNLFFINYKDSVWTLGYALCVGPIEDIHHVWINGEIAKPTVTIVERYGEIGQGIPTILTAAIPSYADNLVSYSMGVEAGIAYVALEYTDTDYDDWPEVVVELSGRKVYNPSSATTVFSSNPALWLADVITDPLWGNNTVDWPSVEAVQDYCDELTTGDDPEVRREGYLVLDSPTAIDSVLDLMKFYASCFIVRRGSVYHLVPDKPSASVMTIDTTLIVNGSVTIGKMDSSDLPTVIQASYTDTQNDVWRERLCLPVKRPGVDTGQEQWRESRINMIGVNRHTQAYRECIERMNKLWWADLSITWQMFEEAVSLEAGDIVSFTHPYIGGITKLLRLIDDPIQQGPALWGLVGIEYSADQYNNEVVQESADGNDGNLPAQTAPNPPTNLQITESTYKTQNNQFPTRLTLTWTAPVSSIVTGYHVVISSGASTVWSGDTTTPNITTPALQELVLFAISVRAYNILSVSSETLLGTYTVIGKTAIPLSPTEFSGYEVGGEVRLFWNASTDVDALRYALRYYPANETWDSASAKDIDTVDSLRLLSRDVPPGTWKFGIKTIDSINNYSVTPSEVVFSVTSDSNAFALGDIDPIVGYDALTYVYRTVENRRTQEGHYYSDGNDSWDSLFPNVIDTYNTTSIAGVQSPQGTSVFLSDELALGEDRTGDFRALFENVDNEAGAAPAIELGTKPDSGTYTYLTALSQKKTARYAQLKISSTGIFHFVLPQGYIRADVVATEESETATTSTSASAPAYGARIQLENDYGAAKSIQVTPYGTTSSSFVGVVDNIDVTSTPNTFDVYIFDDSGQKVETGAEFFWSFKGV